MGAEISIKQGDLTPTIRQTLRDGSGAPLDLSGCTVTFRLRRKGLVLGETIIAAGVVTLLDAVNGRVEYAWVTGDTASPGYFAGEWIVVFPVDKPLTSPSNGFIFVRINPNLSAVE